MPDPGALSAAVAEITFTSGVGPYQLQPTPPNALAAYFRFADVFVDGAAITYEVDDTAQKEICRGVFDLATDTLSRDVVLFSTMGNALINWPNRGQRTVRPLSTGLPLCDTPPMDKQVLAWDAAHKEYCPEDLPSGLPLCDTPPMNGQALLWDAATMKYCPGDVGGGGEQCWSVRSTTFLAYTMNSLMGYIISGGTGYRQSDIVNNFGDLVLPVGGMIGTHVPSPYGRSAVLSVLGVSGGVVTDLSSSDAGDVPAGGLYVYPPANPVSQLSSTGPGTGLLFDVRTDVDGWERLAWSNVLMSSDGRIIYGSGAPGVINPVTGQRTPPSPIARSLDGGLTWSLATPFEFDYPNLNPSIDCASSDLTIMAGRGIGLGNSASDFTSIGFTIMYSEDAGKSFGFLAPIIGDTSDGGVGNVACSGDGRFLMFSAIAAAGTVMYTGTVTVDGTVRSAAAKAPGKGYLVGDQITLIAPFATTPVVLTVSAVTLADIRNVSVVSGGTGNAPGLPQFRTSDGGGLKPIVFGSVDNSGVVTSIPLISNGGGYLTSNLSAPSSEPMTSIGGGSGVELAFTLSVVDVTVNSGEFPFDSSFDNPYYQDSTTGSGLGASFTLGSAQVASWDVASVDTTGGDLGGFVTLAVAVSSNGTVRVAADNQQPFTLPGPYSGLFFSNGGAWESSTIVGAIAPDQARWLSIACSSDGSMVVAVPDGGYLLASSNGGATYSAVTAAGDNGWYGPISISADGNVIAAKIQNAGLDKSFNGSALIYSLDRGVTWSEIPGAEAYGVNSITLSADGKRLATATSSTYGTIGNTGLLPLEASLTVLELPCSSSDPV